MVQWLRLHLPKEKLKKISPPNPGVWVPSQVGELKSHMSCGQKKKKNNNQTQKHKTGAIL